MMLTFTLAIVIAWLISFGAGFLAGISIDKPCAKCSKKKTK